MLPDGWKTYLLDDVTQRRSGHTPDKETPSYWNGGIKWVSLADSSSLDKGVIHTTDKEISDEGVKNSSAVMLPEGTVVLSRDAGVGKSAILAAPMAVSQHFIAWDCSKSKEIHNWFLYHWLQRHKPEFERIAVGSTIKTIGLPYFKKLKISAPPVSEQRRISDVLAAWDSAIATAERLLANSREQKLILTQQLLSGRKRLGSSIPWPKRPISELIQESRVLGSGGDIARKITIKLYAKGVYEKSDKRLGSESTQYYRRSSGQFIYSKLDFLNGAFGLVPPALDGFESTLDLPAFDFLPDVDSRWFFYFVSREEFYSNQLGLASGGRKARRVNPKDLLKVSISVPSVEEQRTIANAIDLAAQIVRADGLQLQHLRAEKSALMQQLLTGKRRVRLPSQIEAKRK